MEDGRIRNSKITSSSIYSSLARPYYGRLNKVFQGTGGAWTAANRRAGEYLQIDLGSRKLIHKVATQGRATRHNQYVTKYILKYSDDGIQWTDYTVNCETKVGIYLSIRLSIR